MNYYIFTDYECMKFNVLSHQTIGSCLIDNSKRDHIRQAKVSLQPKKIVMHEPIYYKCHTKYWWKQIILFAPHHLLFSKLTSVARKLVRILYSSFFIFYFFLEQYTITADGDEKYTIFGPIEIGTKVSCQFQYIFKKFQEINCMRHETSLFDN